MVNELEKAKETERKLRAAYKDATECRCHLYSGEHLCHRCELLTPHPIDFEAIVREAKAETFESVRYFTKGIYGDEAGAIYEFCTRRIIELGGTFDEDRNFSGIKASKEGRQ